MGKDLRVLAGGVFISFFLCAVVSVTIFASGSWTEGTFRFDDRQPVAPIQPSCIAQNVRIGGLQSTQVEKVCIHERIGWRYGTYTQVSGPPYARTYAQVFVVGMSGDIGMYPVEGLSSASLLEVPNSNDLLYNYFIPNLINSHQLMVIRDFPSHLQPRIIAGPSAYMTYTLKENSMQPLIADGNGEPVTTAAARASANGRWLGIEFMGLGLVEMDMQTGQLKLFSNYRHWYGVGSDANITFVISNDGRYVATFDYNIQPKIYTLSDSCVVTGYTFAVLRERAQNYQSCPDDNNQLVRVMQAQGLDRGTSADSFSYDGDTLYFHQIEYTDMMTNSTTYELQLHAGNYVASTNLEYLALGDSYSSGEGDVGKKSEGGSYYLPLTDINADTCHLSSRSYPFLLRDYLHIEPSKMKSVACSGAQVVLDYNRPPEGYFGQRGQLQGRGDIKQTRETALEKFIPGRVPQLEFVKKYQPKIVTLTGGGNDVGFGDMLAYCAYGSPDIDSTRGKIREGFYGVFTCDYAKPDSTLQRLALKNIDDQYSYTLSLLKKIKEYDSEAKIYLIGYPSFISSDTALCTNSLELDSDERAAIQYYLERLNENLRRAAESEGVRFVDTTDSLNGGRLCEGSKYITGFWDINSSDPTGVQNLFHPNALGHQKMSESIYSKISDTLSSPTQSNNRPSSIGNIIYEGIAKLLSMTSNDLPRNGTASISIGPYMFQPGSSVKATLHSDPIDLGALTVGADGSIDQQISLHNLPAGYHVLVLEGVSYSGEPLTVYQFVTVGLSEDKPLLASTTTDSSSKDNVGQSTNAVPFISTDSDGSSSRIGQSQYADILSDFSEKRSDQGSEWRPVAKIQPSEKQTESRENNPPWLWLVGVASILAVMSVIYLRRRV